MFKKYSEKVLIFLFLLFLIVFHFSFLSILPPVLSNINLLLLFLVFYLAFFGLKPSLYYAFFIGIVFDILSFNFFGVHTIAFLASIFLLNFFLVNFFTNKSLYSFLALNLLAVIFYSFIFKIIILVKNLFFQEQLELFFLNLDFWINFSYQVIGNLILTILLFYIVNFTTKRFRLAFLEDK